MKRELDNQPRIAFYGGSFDPVHLGHITTARRLTTLFQLDEFVFVPAFHAPHKKRLAPTSAIDRYTMLALATNIERNISVSKIELDVPSRPYTVDTLTRLKELLPDAELLFVMGSDSWRDIRTWREWETVLTLTNHIVVARPGYEVSGDNLTEELRERILDLRGRSDPDDFTDDKKTIFFTDAVNLDIAASSIRRRIREKTDDWRDDVPLEVAKYIEKYQIYS